MRVVFDTNVVLSGILWGGKPQLALEAIQQGYATLVGSEALLAELESVLSRAKFAPKLAEASRTVPQLIERYRAMIEIIIPADVGRVIPNDPKDDMVIACAVGGNVDIIASGDRHLLGLGQYADIRIITVDDFLNEIGFLSS